MRFLSNWVLDWFVVMGLIVLFLGELGLIRSEDFSVRFELSDFEFEVFELDLVEFDVFEVELSFLSWVLILMVVVVSLVESSVGLMSLVLFLDKPVGALINLVWFLVDKVVGFFFLIG